MSYSKQGLSCLSRNYHRVYREHLCRGKYKTEPRPVLINNWEATYFDFNGDKILKIAEQAAGLGVEMMVLDDGWFGKRDSDLSGLGDWFVNEEKLSGTLSALVERINGLGLKFGIWVEPEMVSEDSGLYEEGKPAPTGGSSSGGGSKQTEAPAQPAATEPVTEAPTEETTAEETVEETTQEETTAEETEPETTGEVGPGVTPTTEARETTSASGESEGPGGKPVVQPTSAPEKETSS